MTNISSEVQRAIEVLRGAGMPVAASLLEAMENREGYAIGDYIHLSSVPVPLRIETVEIREQRRPSINWSTGAIGFNRRFSVDLQLISVPLSQVTPRPALQITPVQPQPERMILP